MDSEPHEHPGSEGLRGLEGEVCGQGPALLLPAQPLPPDHQGAAGRDAQVSRPWPLISQCSGC